MAKVKIEEIYEAVLSNLICPLVDVVCVFIFK